MTDLIEKIIINYKKEKILEASKVFCEGMKKSKMRLKDVIKSSENMRKDIYAEWFK